MLSGVFTPAGDPWTVPVEIDANGNPSMADPNDPATFQQGMNNYHSAKLGFYSRSHRRDARGALRRHQSAVSRSGTQMIETDFNLPFVNDITSVVIDADGNYSQNHLGFFPELFDTQNRRLRFGTNAEFLPADGVPTFENGVIDFDALAAGNDARLHLRRHHRQCATRPQQSGRTLQRVEPHLRSRAGPRAGTGHPRTGGDAAV